MARQNLAHTLDGYGERVQWLLMRLQGDRMEHNCLFYPVTWETRDLDITHCSPHQAALNHMVDVISGKARDSTLSIQHAIASVRVAVAVNQSLEQENSTVHLSSSA